MSKLMMALVAFFSLSMAALDADAARRVGGGSSIGKQRSVTPPAAAPKAPAQSPAAAPAPAAPQPSGMSRWLGPLAGLALGAGLASLFMNNGLGGALAGIMLLLLIAAAAVFAFRMLRARGKPAALRYAGAGPAPVPDMSTNFGAPAASAPLIGTRRYPPGFNAEQFVQHAKLNFQRMQAANDEGDVAVMRDFMTPALYSEIAGQVGARGEAKQKTEIVALEADVLEVVTEGDEYVASVRFSGTIREQQGALAEPFSEVWHLEKPVTGNSGWLISGIQQD